MKLRAEAIHTVDLLRLAVLQSSSCGSCATTAISRIDLRHPSLAQPRPEPKPEVLQRHRSQMQQRNCPKPPAASQQEKRPFVVSSAKSGGLMAELRTKPPFELTSETTVSGVKPNSAPQARRAIKSAAFSAIMMTGALGWPVFICGITDASAMDRP